MITDKETNLVYLAHSLPYRYTSFSALFEEALEECGIPYSYIPNTKDVWAVDYMPIQVSKDKLVQFVYNPDYLKKAKKWRDSISAVDAICEQMGLKPLKSPIVLDGGNVVRGANKVILCNKVFRENKAIPEKQLMRQLEDLLQVDQLIFVPQDPHDEIGHADGMVRFLDERTVLINDYSKESECFQIDFRTALHNSGLKAIEIPYNPYGNKTYLQANGTYINYLHMAQAVVVPVFGLTEDDSVIRQFEELFRGQRVTTVYSKEIANDGGVLNCVTWNILMT